MRRQLCEISRDDNLLLLHFDIRCNSTNTFRREYIPPPASGDDEDGKDSDDGDDECTRGDADEHKRER